MRRISCRRAKRRLDERALGIDVTGPEQAALEDHLLECAACAEREALGRGLQLAARNHPLPELPPLIERRMLAARDPALATQVPRPRLVVRPWIHVVALGTVAVALVAVLIHGLSPGRGPAQSDETPDPGSQVVVAEDPVSPVAVRVVVPLRAVPCSAAGTTLWLSADADVRVLRNDARRARFLMERGQVLADIGENEPDFEFVVETPHLSLLARGTVFVVDIDDLGRESVRVHEGVVEVRELATEGGPISLAAGMQLGWGDTVPIAVAPDAAPADLAFAGLDLSRLDLREPVHRPSQTTIDAHAQPLEETLSASRVETAVPAIPSASELTRQAHAHQRAREYDQACLAYTELIEAYPGSVAAQNTLVALGQIELAAGGQPHSALARFQGYLDEVPDGLLAEEARLGRVRALAAGGRHDEGIVAASDFLERHPGSHALAEVMRLRGDAHRLAGHPLESAADYRQVIENWGDTGQAVRAQQQLDILEPQR